MSLCVCVRCLCISVTIKHTSVFLAVFWVVGFFVFFFVVFLSGLFVAILFYFFYSAQARSVQYRVKQMEQ